MERRKFIINSGIAASSLMLFSGCKSLLSQDALNSIGVQLFSFPKLLEKDFNAGIKMVSEMGYKEIEMFGPFNFSVEAAKKRWKSITPMLGFNGSGYFGHTLKEIKTILDEHNIKVTSIHSDMDTMQTRMEEIAKESEQLGFEYVVLPAIPEEKRQTLDDYKRVVEEFNEIGHSGEEQFGAFSYKPGFAINPLKFLIGLAEQAQKSGVKIYQKSKVDKIEKHSGKFNIITNDHIVTTNKIVMATNGFYQDDLFPKLNNMIL